ncbi:MAG: 3-oxoacyl-ACP reductase [Bordetella sp. SCN 67-23]|nr:SDR family oxidoreductase [Burkholderiales bacterium]ODS73316.1 MAG: 3-oxoacyl-ACP reductase [Bordetella sp. SCN 67-23]OJW92846.1 MAG: 3-oxoacyl-ACP reductase [Burkholderiales bacterium 67-32]
MDLGLNGRVALVLGAGGGLGGAIAHALAREGAHVAAADVDPASLAATVESITGKGGRALAVPMDLARPDMLQAGVVQIGKALGPVEILVNNSGGPPPTRAGGVDAGTWESHFRSMVVSLMSLTDLVLPAMQERRWGRIITSASSGVVSPIPNLGISNTLRMALVGWSKTLAAEVAPYGITANVIVPGRIATDRIRQLDEARARREGKEVEEIARLSTATIPMRRYGDPSEYADTVAFLASERASYTTGSVVRVDGGLIPSV